MASFYEIIGHGQWVDAQEAVGRKVPDVVREAPARRKPKPPTHTYGECANGPSRCKRHRAVYRAMLAKSKERDAQTGAAASRDAALQGQLHAQRVARIAAAARKDQPANPPRPVNVFCERGEHDKCDLEGKGRVNTAQGPRACGCSHHHTPQGEPPIKRDTKVRLRWEARTKCTTEELVDAIVAGLAKP